LGLQPSQTRLDNLRPGKRGGGGNFKKKKGKNSSVLIKKQQEKIAGSGSKDQVREGGREGGKSVRKWGGGGGGKIMQSLVFDALGGGPWGGVGSLQELQGALVTKGDCPCPVQLENQQNERWEIRLTPNFQRGLGRREAKGGRGGQIQFKRRKSSRRFTTSKCLEGNGGRINKIPGVKGRKERGLDASVHREKKCSKGRLT